MTTNNSYFDTERSAIADLVPADATTILDVGCGAGWLGAALKRSRPVVVWGVEPFAEAAALARTRLDVVLQESLETAWGSLEGKYFDCIVLADVLEHLADPWTAVERLKIHLSPNGVIVASIPNAAHSTAVQGLLMRKWRYASEGVLDRTHLRFFARNTVEELFWNAGLRIAALGTHELIAVNTKDIGRRLSKAGFEMAQSDTRTFQFHVVAALPPEGQPAPEIAVLILNWNGAADTLRCLATVTNQDYPLRLVVVVDNGSTDGSVESIRTRFPDVEILRVDTNRGYSGGNNLGLLYFLQTSGVDHVLILNNDTLLPPDFIRKLVEAQAILGPRAILAPQVLYASDPNRIWYAGAEWNVATAGFDVEGADCRVDRGDFEMIHETAVAIGCSMFVPVVALEEVGLFDERFFLVHEESDWCYRVKERGYRCFVIPAAKLLHKVSSSFGSPEAPLMQYFDQRNRLLFVEKHFPLRILVRTLSLTIRRTLRRVPRPRLAPPAFLPPAKGFRKSARRWYWALRDWTMALNRWRHALRNRATATQSRRSRLAARARRLGIRDYLFRRFGDCPARIRRMNEEWLCD